MSHDYGIVLPVNPCGGRLVTAQLCIGDRSPANVISLGLVSGRTSLCQDQLLVVPFTHQAWFYLRTGQVSAVLVGHHLHHSLAWEKIACPLIVDLMPCRDCGLTWPAVIENVSQSDLHLTLSQPGKWLWRVTTGKIVILGLQSHI